MPDGVPAAIRTTCPYCGVGCGVVATPDGAGGLTVAGDPDHPANRGRLCSKGSALAETFGLEGRLLAPEIDDRPVGWDAALDHVAGRFSEIVREHGPDAVGFYVSGQLLTEDYYVANKLLKGFIGSRHLDTNSRLCMASSVAGHRRAFGGDVVPGNYEDLELADLVVLVGSNLAWCHPVLFQRLVAAKAARPEMRVVVVDPRRTATCDIADLHLAIDAGGDVPLFAGLLVDLERSGLAARDWLAAHASGDAETLAAARTAAPDAAAVAAATGLPRHAVERFYAWFGATERVVTVYSQGVNQSTSGVDKVNAIVNAHLLTGRIGRPGMGPFSVTGQPNAMGGREVGALANMLAAHMTYDDPADVDRVRRFWDAPRIASSAGHKAVDFFRAVERGEIRAVWVMATNPAVSLPDASQVVRALRAAEFVVVSDFVRDTDTARLADVRLPAAAWGEKSGTVTNSERRISRQRAALPAPGAARPDWWIVSQVARRMGFGAAFAYDRPADIFREHAALSAFENDGARAFDIGALAALDDGGYDALSPIQWPFPAGAAAPTERMFGDGVFLGSGGRARLVPTPPRPRANATDRDYPLTLNTGRYRDQWHTMTRTGRAPRLATHLPEPLLEVHPRDAEADGLVDGGFARIESRWGEATLRVRVTDAQRRGACFAPMHWTAALAATGRVNDIVNPDVDPISGQPELKATPVRLSPVAMGWHGFVVARERLRLDGFAYWIEIRGEDHWRYELAGPDPADEAWPRVAALAGDAARLDWLEYLDNAAGRFRAAAVTADRVAFAAYAAGDARALPTREWVSGLCAREALTARERHALLAGRDPGRSIDPGPIVCSCFSVGRTAIAGAIAGGCRSAAAVGERVKAGTNCGSCLPEIRALIAAATRAA